MNTEFDEKTFVLGIGAAKAGTTWLHRYLESRSDFYMSPIKELHYFDAKYRDELSAHFNGRFIERMVNRMKRGGFAKGNDGMASALLDRVEMIYSNTGYREYFETRVPEDCGFYGEVTPSYALLPVKAFREIKDLLPKIRIIFLLRDPIDRLYSQLRMGVRKGHFDSASKIFMEALEQPLIIERSLYQDSIKRLEKVFAPEEIHIAFYETFFSDGDVGQLCEFLGCEFQPGDYEKRVNEGAGSSQPAGLDREMIDAGKSVFAEVYTFCRERYGDRVPDTWLG